MMRRLALATLFLLVCCVRPAAAATAVCSAYASSIVFGNYSGTVVDVTGTVTVTCTSGTTYSIGLNAGNTPGATVTNRLMYGGAGGQSTLGYQLFSNASHSSNWGNTSGAGWVTGTGNGSAQTYTVYAQIPANESSPLGSYTDTIIASVTGNFTTVTAYFSVTATVAPGCSISATPLSFGTYSGTLSNSTAGITVSCPSGTQYNVGLNAGTATGATVTTRKMQSGSNTLSYTLYSNSGQTTNWGNTVGTDTVAGKGTGTSQSLTVYGQIPAGQRLTPGSYSDTITATLTY